MPDGTTLLHVRLCGMRAGISQYFAGNMQGQRLHCRPLQSGCGKAHAGSIYRNTRLYAVLRAAAAVRLPAACKRAGSGKHSPFTATVFRFQALPGALFCTAYLEVSPQRTQSFTEVSRVKEDDFET